MATIMYEPIPEAKTKEAIGWILALRKHFLSLLSNNIKFKTQI